MINPYDIIRGKKSQYLDSSFHDMAFLQVIKAYPLNSRWTTPDCDYYIAPVLGIHPPTKPLWHTHSCGPTAHIGVVMTMYRIAAAGISVLIITVTRWIQGTATGSSTRMRQWDSWERLWCSPWFLWLMNGDHTVTVLSTSWAFLSCITQVGNNQDILPDFWTILVFFLVKW